MIDAEGQTLGRLANLAACYIRGKHNVTYTPSMDMGAYVVVINAEKVTVSGRKPEQKTYFRHVNGRPGSWKIETFNELQRVRGVEWSSELLLSLCCVLFVVVVV